MVSRLLKLVRILWVIAALTLAPPSIAHHSFAMFDFQKNVTLVGSVKEFQWGNPHVFIDLLVPDAGGPHTWSIELTSPSHLVRNGWKPTSLKTGDEVSIVIHPLRDGRNGGTYVSGAHADGSAVVGPPRAAKQGQP